MKYDTEEYHGTLIIKIIVCSIYSCLTGTYKWILIYYGLWFINVWSAFFDVEKKNINTINYTLISISHLCTFHRPHTITMITFYKIKSLLPMRRDGTLKLCLFWAMMWLCKFLHSCITFFFTLFYPHFFDFWSNTFCLIN